MGSVDAAHSASAHHHHQDGLRQRVLFVVAVLGNHSQPRAAELRRPVALFAGFRGRDEPVALHRGLNRPGVIVEDDAQQLARAGHLALYPARGARRHVTLDAQDAGVRRDPVGRKLRLHDMAGFDRKTGAPPCT